MLRLLALSLVAAFTIFGAASAEVVDHGPPYTDEQFYALAPERLPNGFNSILHNWWPRAPGYLRARILNARSEMWWPIILCNGLGFKPEGMDAGGADKCEQDAYRGSQRGKSMWSEDGRWIGPSEACKKRDRRTQYGELICD